MSHGSGAIALVKNGDPSYSYRGHPPKNHQPFRVDLISDSSPTGCLRTATIRSNAGLSDPTPSGSARGVHAAFAVCV